jgi:hypothetical protein
LLVVFVFAIGFVLLPCVTSLRIYILLGVVFYRKLLLLWSGLLQRAVSWVARVRALFTQLMMIVLTCTNLSIIVGMQLTLYNKWHNVVNLGWEWIELDHWPSWESFITCVTNDFATQNVILHMGLWLLSPLGIHVYELHRFVPSFTWS